VPAAAAATAPVAGAAKDKCTAQEQWQCPIGLPHSHRRATPAATTCHQAARGGQQAPPPSVQRISSLYCCHALSVCCIDFCRRKYFRCLGSPSSPACHWPLPLQPALRLSCRMILTDAMALLYRSHFAFGEAHRLRNAAGTLPPLALPLMPAFCQWLHWQGWQLSWCTARPYCWSACPVLPASATDPGWLPQGRTPLCCSASSTLC
jgi:hypothetical protein